MSDYKEDEKAADKYAYPGDLYNPDQGGNIIIDSMRNAFLAGCQHIRTSAEWRGVEEQRDAWHRLCSEFLPANQWPDHGDCSCLTCSMRTLYKSQTELDRIRSDK